MGGGQLLYVLSRQWSLSWSRYSLADSFYRSDRECHSLWMFSKREDDGVESPYPPGNSRFWWPYFAKWERRSSFADSKASKSRA